MTLSLPYGLWNMDGNLLYLYHYYVVFKDQGIHNKISLGNKEGNLI